MFQNRPNRSHLQSLAAGASLLAAVLLLGSVAAMADESSLEPSACVEEQCGQRCQSAVALARRSSSKYLREAVALAEGFVPDPICIAAPGVGTMGFHYPNPARMMDLEVHPTEPEILLYAERPDGRRYLVALEYYAPVLSGGQPWFGGVTEPPPTIDNPPPVLFGRTFDGPMPGHNPSMPWHYDLHVWAWQHNPAGLFALFNPSFSCP